MLNICCSGQANAGPDNENSPRNMNICCGKMFNICGGRANAGPEAGESMSQQVQLLPDDARKAVRRHVSEARKLRRSYLNLKNAEQQLKSALANNVALIFVLLGVWALTGGQGLATAAAPNPQAAPPPTSAPPDEQGDQRTKCLGGRQRCICLWAIFFASLLLMVEMFVRWRKLRTTTAQIEDRIQDRDALKRTYEQISNHHPIYHLETGEDELATEFSLEVAFGDLESVWAYDVKVDLTYLVGLGPEGQAAVISLPIAVVGAVCFVAFILFQAVWCSSVGCPLGWHSVY